MIKKLSELWAKRHELPEGDQATVQSLVVESRTLEALAEMKNTAGWKILNTKMREELHNRIYEKVKDDEKIQTLLGILTTADVKNSQKVLEEAIDQIIPE